MRTSEEINCFIADNGGSYFIMQSYPSQCGDAPTIPSSSQEVPVYLSSRHFLGLQCQRWHKLPGFRGGLIERYLCSIIGNNASGAESSYVTGCNGKSRVTRRIATHYERASSFRHLVDSGVCDGRRCLRDPVLYCGALWTAYPTGLGTQDQ